MDFESLLSKYEAKACVVSVDFYEDETYGNIRILAGNKAHCDEMEMVQIITLPQRTRPSFLCRYSRSGSHCTTVRVSPKFYSRFRCTCP